MNADKIIFLGLANNIEEFCSIFSKEETNQEILMVCEEVKLYKDENVITITEEEVKQYFGDYKNIKELRDISIRYFAKNIQGRTIDIGEYKNIRTDKNNNRLRN